MRSAHSRYEVVSALDSALQAYVPLYPDDWEDCLNTLDECFMSVPVPPPCLPAAYSGSTCGTGANSTAPPINVQRVVVDSGCFHPDSLVTLSNGTKLPCKQLSKGAEVLTHDNVRDTILTVVKSRASHLYKLPDGGPRVTAWHPVFWRGEWRFPAEISGAVKIEYVGEVYSFLLASRGVSLIFDGIPGVALAHGLSGLPKHAFWGTEAVVRNMLKLQPDTLETGVFNLGDTIVHRDKATNEVLGFSALNVSKM